MDQEIEFIVFLICHLVLTKWNIANSGIFSADRAVLDYARDIWYASPVPMGK